jgi:hypothetical protein
MQDEPTNTSYNRIKIPRKVSEPVYIDLRDLEAIKEDYLAKQRERVEQIKGRETCP